MTQASDHMSHEIDGSPWFNSFHRIFCPMCCPSHFNQFHKQLRQHKTCNSQATASTQNLHLRHPCLALRRLCKRTRARACNQRLRVELN